jgi:hypothetical protein
MSQSKATCALIAMLSLTTASSQAANRAPTPLLSTPVEVTGTFGDNDVGVYFAQISVHSGPIAQLVDTTVHANSADQAATKLRQALSYRAPYLLVHTSCGGGATRSCEREVVFKIAASNVVVRLGEIIGTATTIRAGDHFRDRYDKLEQRIDGLSQATSPTFTVMLSDVNNSLAVDTNATWITNQELWRNNAGTITANEPDKTWKDSEWETYFSAVVTNAALARYCDRNNELQALLQEVEPKLDATHRRSLSDALALVVPAQSPKQWRNTP